LYRSPFEFSRTSSASPDYTFAPNVLLIPGAAYILFAYDGDTDYAAYPGNLGMGYLGTDIYHGVNAYSGGGFRFLPKGPPLSSWNTVSWDDPTAFGDSSPENDVPFSAEFGSVPEPANFGEAILGITTLGLICAWKKRSSCIERCSPFALRALGQ
jgi:hypothetical protein